MGRERSGANAGYDAATEQEKADNGHDQRGELGCSLGARQTSSADVPCDQSVRHTVGTWVEASLESSS